MCTRYDTGDELEQARYGVETEEIIVNGARIMCNCAGRNGKPNYIKVLDGHGIMENGNNCAHDGSCIPIENIRPFSSCIAVNTKRTLTSLLYSADEEAKKRYMAALKAINENETTGRYMPVPCALPLLDRWFDADEKKTVTDIMEQRIVVMQKLKELQKGLEGALQSTIKDLLQQIGKFSNTEEKLAPDSPLFTSYMSVKAQRNHIEELYTKINNRISPGIILDDSKFRRLAIQLEEIGKHLNEIKKQWNLAYNSYKGLKNYEEYGALLDQYINETDELLQKINNLEEKEYHLITTKSFLVCRCGGIISFVDSGQEFMKTVDNLMASILSMITEFKEDCQRGMTDCCGQEWDYDNQEWSSYKAAVEGLGVFEKMMLGSGETENTMDTCIYLELICHSYNEEVNKTVMSVLSLLSLFSAELTFVMAECALKAMAESTNEKSIFDAMDGASAAISDVSSKMDMGLLDAGAIMPPESLAKTIGKSAIRVNNLYTVITSVFGFFYVSYETWIENVRITVFTDSHAHVYEGKLDEKGNILAKMNVRMWTKGDYKSGDLGYGLKWKEDPGVYVRRFASKGDNMTAEGAKTSTINEIIDGVGIYNP